MIFSNNEYNNNRTETYNKGNNEDAVDDIEEEEGGDN